VSFVFFVVKIVCIKNVTATENAAALGYIAGRSSTLAMNYPISWKDIPDGAKVVASPK